MPNKVQFNIYVKPQHKDYIENVVEDTDVETNSDAITLLIAYAEKYWSDDDWNRLFASMKVFGEEGLIKL